jgi:hypothetical protein
MEDDRVLGLPFYEYQGGGRGLLGVPPWGDGSSRRGYGVPVLRACGTSCVYCGVDLGGTYEAWLGFSVDHVIPVSTVKRLGYPAEWVHDLINLVTACRSCNEFLNAYRVDDPCPPDLDGFCDLRDRHFLEKRGWAVARHATERGHYDAWRARLKGSQSCSDSDRDPVGG